MVVKKTSMNSGSEAPTGIKIISVLYYIGAVLALIVGILLLVGAGFAGPILASVPGLALVGAGLFVVAGIIVIALAVLEFFIGRGLWGGQNWARVVAIIIAIIGVLSSLSSLISGFWVSGIIYLVIHGWIGWYLWFNADSKMHFASK